VSVLALSAAGLFVALIRRDRTLWVMAFAGGATVIAYVLVVQAFSIAEWSATARFTAPGIALGLIILAVAVSRFASRAHLFIVPLFCGTILVTQFDAQLWRGWWRLGGIKVFFVGLVGTAVIAIAAALV